MFFRLKNHLLNSRSLCVGFLFAWLVGVVFVPVGSTQAAPLPGSFSCSSVIEISQTDCKALVALYTSTDGDNWRRHTNWLATDTPSDWYGVTVVDGRVTTLFLSNNLLNGNIPAQLGTMSQLQTLFLGSNGLSGSIPPQLGNLSELQTLDLNRNVLSGSIPAQLSSLSVLQDLYLSNNHLSGSIPPELGSLSSLGVLYLNNNQLSGSIPAELGSLETLKYLNFAFNQLSGDVPAMFPHLTLLADPDPDGFVYLNLRYNQLYTPAPTPELEAFLARKDPVWASTQNISNPIPELTGFTPGSATAGSSEFTLTVNGNNFIKNSIVRWEDTDLVTTYISARQLTVIIPKASLFSSEMVNITVVNPIFESGTSGILVFPITTPNEKGTGALIPPGSPGSLTFTDPDDPAIYTIIVAPAGAVSSATQLTYIEKAIGAGNEPVGFVFGGRHFTLSAYVDGEAQAGFTFKKPVRITLSYPTAPSIFLADTLELRYWNAAARQWLSDGITMVSRDPVHRQVVVDITHLSEFTLLFKGYQNFLPLFLN